MTKFVVGQWLCLVLILALGQARAVAAVTPAPEVEQSTESPIADMALIEDAPMAPKSPTEKPPVAEAAPAGMEKAASAAAAAAPVPVVAPGQTHTVADFIIHPLIAFKPRQASLEEIQGKQAATPAAGGTPAAPSTWLFGMNPAQQLGSSFSTLAGSVSGWINDRLGQQLPSFVESPVQTSSTTAAPATTSTTQKPDIVVRVQQRPSRNGNRRGNGNGNGNANFNGNGNGNGLGIGNGNGNRRRQRPNRFNNRLDSFEDDYYEDDYFQGNRFDEEFDDDEDDLSLEHFEDDDSLELRPQQKPKRKQTQAAAAQKPKRKQQKKQQQEQMLEQEQEQEEVPQVAQVVSQKRRQSQGQSQNKRTKAQKKPVQVPEDSDDEEELDDDEHEDDDDDDDVEEVLQDDDQDSREQGFLPEPIFGSSSSTRRSQNQPNFIQRGQQSLISQIRQFARGQAPVEAGSKLRRTSLSGSGSAQTRRPQQTTLLVNRNGQTVYVAPELLGLNQPQLSGYPYAYQGKRQRLPATGGYPQPPLTVPVRRQGRPTQYITIPWSQLGLSPPDQQSVVSLAEGIQAQPLILNIPQSAIQPVRGTSGSAAQQQKKKKRPQLTASAVPLLADASLMDIFQPPQIPPSRTGSSTASSIKPINAQPVLIAAKPVKAGGSGVLPTRIRPGTIVEKAPALDAMEKPAMEATEMKQQEEEQQQQMMAASTEAAAQMGASEQQEFIIVGDDDEPGLSRHVQPVYGDARYVSYGDFHPYFDLLTQNRRFALRKSGRSLESPEEQAAPKALTTFGKGEVVKEEIKKEEAQKEEIKKEEVQKEEIKKEEVQKEEIKKEEMEMKMEEIKKEEAPQQEEIKQQEIKKEEIKKEEIKKEEIKKEETEKESPKHEEPALKTL